MAAHFVFTLFLVLIFLPTALSWWSRWTPYSACSASCGIGRMTKTRTCHGDPATCRGRSNRTIYCRTQRCPIWYVWGYWSPCTASCGGGTQSRSRTCQGGSTCAGSSTSSRPCNDQSCLRNRYLHLVNPVYTIKKTGLLVAWQFYAKKPGTINLQIYRRKIVIRGFVYDLIGENTYEITTPGSQLQDVTAGEQISVRRGDVVGFYFTPSAPTADNPPSLVGCLSNTLWVRNPVTVSVGHRFFFNGGAGSWKSCQKYELQVEIQTGVTMGVMWQGFGSESTCAASCGNGTHASPNMCSFYEDVSCIGINVHTLTCDGPCPENDSLYPMRKQTVASALLATWNRLGEEKFWS